MAVLCVFGISFAVCWDVSSWDLFTATQLGLQGLEAILNILFPYLNQLESYFQ